MAASRPPGLFRRNALAFGLERRPTSEVGFNIAAAGNLVKIEDGCATVKGYKPPVPLDSHNRIWEGGGKA